MPTIEEIERELIDTVTDGWNPMDSFIYWRFMTIYYIALSYL